MIPLTKAKFLLWMWQQRWIDRPHLSSLTDSANVWGTTPAPSFGTNARNTSVQCSIWNREGKPPCKCICNERHVQEVHYSLSATFISEYQMNMINVERGGGGSRGEKQSKPRIWDEWYCYYTTNDEQQKLRQCEIVVLGRGEHTVTYSHTLSRSFPCKHVIVFSFFFLQCVKPRHNSTLIRFPVVRWYATTMGCGGEKNWIS